MTNIKNYIVKIIIRLARNKRIEFSSSNTSKIVFLQGMFRTGTSLTCQLLNQIGLPHSPKWRLLRGTGRLKNLNPDGFFEDYLFAQLSRYWYKILKSTGDTPPSFKDLERFKLRPINISNFIEFCEFEAYDERLPFINRCFAYLLIISKKEKAFSFKKKTVIKVPMLTPFYIQLKNWMPCCKFFINIRTPEATIKSAQALTSSSNLSLYSRYYNFLKNTYLSNPDCCIIFSYDNLLQDPDYSINTLINKFNPTADLNIARNLIKTNLIRNKSIKNINNEEYNFLYQKAINKQ